MAKATEGFEPEKIEVEKKGRMVLLYAVTGKEREHMASFFHEHKAKYVTDALKEKYGVKVVTKKATAETVDPKTAKAKVKPKKK